MTRVHLIRHAAFEGVGRIMVGRTEGVSLNELGRAQARDLSEDLAGATLAAVYTSPLERARETAAVIADAHDLTAVVHEAFAELDLGDWTGSAVEDLESHSAWGDFNTLRSLTRIPGGELMLETQTRAIGGLLEIRHDHPDETVAVVTHADVIRAILGYLLGMPMDHLLRLEIVTASCSTIELHGSWPQVHCIGRTAAPAATR